jgi:hypothetical protein
MVKNDICPLVPKLCVDDRGYSMEHNETCFTIFGGRMHLQWILQVLAERTCRDYRTLRTNIGSSDNPRLLSGFGYKSSDTPPK